MPLVQATPSECVRAWRCRRGRYPWAMTEEDDAYYRDLLLDPLYKCADYLPKMGGAVEVDLDGFSALYGSDPLYHWMGLDSPLMLRRTRQPAE